MYFDLNQINQAAEQIQQQLRTGEIGEVCCMSGMASPVTESWEAAQELAEKADLSAAQQQTILKALNPVIRKQMEFTGFDDFDLIYEWLLQLVLFV